MKNSTSPDTRSQAARLLKLVSFPIGSLNVALRIDAVKKIINRTTVYSSGLNHLGMAHVGNQEITVVDLHKRLFNVSQIQESGTQGYLILTKSKSEPFGILVTETPTLMDVSLSHLRILPESYRRADTLEIASHVAVIPPPTEMTVFLLDVERILPRVAQVSG